MLFINPKTLIRIYIQYLLYAKTKYGTKNLQTSTLY